MYCTGALTTYCTVPYNTALISQCNFDTASVHQYFTRGCIILDIYCLQRASCQSTNAHSPFFFQGMSETGVTTHPFLRNRLSSCSSNHSLTFTVKPLSTPTSILSKQLLSQCVVFSREDASFARTFLIYPSRVIASVRKLSFILSSLFSPQGVSFRLLTHGFLTLLDAPRTL